MEKQKRLLHGDQTWFTKYKYTHFSKERAEKFQVILTLCYRVSWEEPSSVHFLLYKLAKQFKRKEPCGWPVKRGAVRDVVLCFFFLTFYPIANYLSNNDIKQSPS